MFGPGLVCDRFQFIQPLPDFVGHRALGLSHVAVDQKEGGEQLWITVVDPPLIPEPGAKSEYVSRARQLTSMRHPSLVRTRAVTDDDQRVFVAYEALPGALVLEDIMTRFGAMSSMLVLDRARSVARGLDALHRRGLVHGGLDGTTVVNWEEQCLLLNYGLFPALNPDRFRELARRTGSVAMWPPEVVRGEFTPAADVFAWGVLVAQMLTGEAAAAAVIELDDHARKYEVGAEFLELIRSCTHTDPAERPRDATHLVARLENFESITTGRVDEVSDAVKLPPPPSEMGAELSLNFVGGSGTSAPSVAADDDDGMISMTDLSSETGNPEYDSSPDMALSETPEPEPERPRTRRKRPAQPTAKLSALAVEIVGEEGVGELGSVFDGEVPREPDASMSSMDLEKLALGVEAAAGSEASLSLIGGGDPNDFDTFASRKTEEPERTPEDPEIKVDRGKKIKLRMPRRTRRPGPHGPPPNFVSRGAIVATGAMTFLFTLHVATERGGYAALVDPAFSQDISSTVDAALEEAKAVVSSVAKMADEPPPVAREATSGASGVAGTTAGDTGSGAAGDTGGSTGGDTATDEVEAPPVYRPCEEGTFAVSETVCIDVAEFPGRRKIPRTNISFRGAEEACDRRGARLCSIDEWQSACEGEARRRYPYGNVVDPYACNTASPAGYPQVVRRSGSTKDCATPGGVYDLIGNVGEWVSDGRAVGGDSTTPHKAVHCGKWGSPPRGFASDLLGFRCCVDRLVE